MKNLALLFLITLLFFGGCSSSQEIEKEITFTGIDFTKYSQNNFLFTPEQYLGDYESIGLLNVVMYPEVKRVMKSENKTKLVQGSLNIVEVIDSIYTKSVSMGADAVVRLNFRSISKLNGIYTVNGIEVTGFAIKRK